MYFRPVVIYGIEIGTILVGDHRVLGVFERKMLLNIYCGVRMEGGSWRVFMSHELHYLFGVTSIVQTAKIRPLLWDGHAARMLDSNHVKGEVLAW